MSRPARRPGANPALPGLAASTGVTEFRRTEDGALWRVERMAELAAEFAGLTPERLPEWETLMARTARGHLIVRRLYGVGPVIVPLDADPDSLRTLTREEVAALLGIDRKSLEAELEELRRRWAKYGDPQAAPAPPPSAEPPPPPRATPPALEMDDTQVLETYGFPGDRMFARDAQDRHRFCERVREWEALFKDRMTATLARSALLNELRIWRVERALASEDPASESKEARARYRQLAEELDSLNQTYQAQLERIEAQAPWFNATGQTLSFKNAVSEMIAGLQEYYADGNRAKLDGIYTAAEIQVLTRTSRQMPEPQYRLGWVTWVNASRQFLWEREGAPQFKQSDLARLDAGFREGVRRFQEESGAHIPDLETEGPGGEYEDLYQAPDPGPAPEQKLYEA